MPGDAGLRALLARVEAAEGPDRSIDVEIAATLGQPQAYFAQFDRDVDGVPWAGWEQVDGPAFFIGEDRWAGGGRSWVAPAYTASLDAAVALVERCLPGWGLRIDFRASQVWLQSPDDVIPFLPGLPTCMAKASAPTVPLALCAALLRALVARGDRDGAAGGEGTGDG